MVDEAVAIGIDIGGTKLVAATIDGGGSVLERRRRETPANDEDLLVSTITSLIVELGAHLPVGVGIAGLVAPDGTYRYGPNLAVRDLPLQARLDEVTSATVAVTNDASAAALGEQRVGAGRGHRDTVLFTLGTGVGGGIVVDGELVVGSQGFGGELGHVIVLEDGRPCPCGNRGCVEAYTSGTSIGIIARERLAEGPDQTSLRDLPYVGGRAVTQAAQDGDRFAQHLLAEAGGWLGVAAASVVNALDPGIVLVGGGAARPAATWLLPSARAALADRLVGSGWRTPPPLELAALGDDAGMVGAGLFAAERDGVAVVDR